MNISPPCPQRFVSRLIGSARVCLFALLVVSALPGPLLAQEEQLPQLPQIDALLEAGDVAQAKQSILSLLKPEFAREHPTEAAVLAGELSEIGRLTGDWSGIYEALDQVAEPLVAALQDEALDAVLADVALAAGMAKQFDAQDRWATRAVALALTQAGEDSERALMARVTAAYALLNAGRDEEALQRMLETLNAMEIYREANMFFNTAGQAGDAFYRLAGQEAGWTIFQRALESPLIETDSGPGKGFLWFNAGVFLRDIGDYEGAIRFQKDAMDYLFGYFGADSREGLSAYVGLAQTMQAGGLLSAADAVYRYVYDVSLKAFGENDPDVWRVANNIAAVARALKRPDDALDFDDFAYEKRRQALGAGANDAVVSFFNIVQDLILAGDFEVADRALGDLAHTIDDPRYDAQFRERVARWRDYVAYRAGKKVLSRAEFKGRRHLDLDTGIELELAFLDLYADHAEEKGWTESALALRTEALEKAQNQFGKTHPASFDAAFDRARLLETLDRQQAVAAYKELNRVMFNWTRATVRLSGSLESGAAARALSTEMRQALADFATRDAEAAEVYAASFDQWKTLTSHAERALRQEAETTEDADYKRLIEAYLNVIGHLREVLTVSLFPSERMLLEQQVKQARAALNAARAERGLPPVGSWTEIETGDFQPASRPAAGDVIVELALTFIEVAEDRSLPIDFAIHALVSRHDRPPEVVELTRSPLQEFDGRLAKVEVFSKNIADRLGEWSKGAKTLTIVPDSFLFRVAFAEIPVDGEKRLGEIVTLHVATSRQAYEFRDRNDHFAKGREALLVGGLILSKNRTTSEYPASGEEVQAIASILRENGREAHLLQGREGTEMRVRAASEGPSVLHLATESFYDSTGDESHQLYNSAFMLAGARLTQQEDSSDNVVYARELLGWNLRGVDLIAITGCQTALGDFGITSSLRGLPLTLQIAGARRTLLTTGKMPDVEAARFMVRFYEHLIQEDMSYTEAFIATKRDAWANRIEGVSPITARYFVLLEN